MADTMTVACPGCEAVFELPYELAGEAGECTECSTIFEIPSVEQLESDNFDQTATGAIKTLPAEEEGGEVTNTVKLSRTSIGMVPTVSDSFNFDVVEKEKNTASSSGGKKFSKTRASAGPRRARKASKPKKKWWEFWK